MKVLYIFKKKIFFYVKHVVNVYAFRRRKEKKRTSANGY